MPQMAQVACSTHETPGKSYDQALALRPDMALATGSNSSVALTAADLHLRAKQMEQRRHHRERHHHSQIWTKDFHGGPYRKARGPCLLNGHVVPSKIRRVASAAAAADRHSMRGSDIGRCTCRQTAQRATTRCYSILMVVIRRWCLGMSAHRWDRQPTSLATT